MQYIGDGTWGGGKEKVIIEINKYIKDYKKHPGFGCFGIVDRKSGQLVGEASLEWHQDKAVCEAGYILRKDYWGQGCATEILKGLLGYACNTLHQAKVIAVAHPKHKASHRVMEKCGMVFEKIITDYGIEVMQFIWFSNIPNHQADFEKGNDSTARNYECGPWEDLKGA